MEFYFYSFRWIGLFHFSKSLIWVAFVSFLWINWSCLVSFLNHHVNLIYSWFWLQLVDFIHFISSWFGCSWIHIYSISSILVFISSFRWIRGAVLWAPSEINKFNEFENGFDWNKINLISFSLPLGELV